MEITDKIKEIDVIELNSILQNNKENIQLIDVREKEEFALTNIGGRNIPLGELLNHIHVIDENKTTVFICRSGRRSSDAVELLQSSYNFNNLYNLKGGLLDWSDRIDAKIIKY